MKHQPTTPEGTALLTINEAAEQLRVSRATVYRLINDGRLATVDIARIAGQTRTRVPRQAIADYIASCATRKAS